MADRLKIVFGHLGSSHHSGDGVLPNAVAATAENIPTTAQFRYTLDGSKLTHDQRRLYEENGFLVIKKLVSPHKLKLYMDRFVQICKREVILPGIILTPDIANKDSHDVTGEQAVIKIQDFQNDDVLFEYCALPEVIMLLNISFSNL